MARRKAKVSQAQRLTGYAILALLGLITMWLLIVQSRLNPAVIVALRAPELQGRIQAVSGQAQTVTASLIPEVSGFTPLTPIESYNRDNLSEKIDGKAELYLSAGFKEMSCRSFDAAGTHVDVYLYDMGLASNAYAVFSGQRRAGSPSIPLTANAYATANALFFTQGQFYVEIVADRASETLRNTLEMFAKALLSKLPSQGEAKGETALFPREGLTVDSVRLNAADAFGLEGLNNVLTGEYTLKSGKATAFIAQRDTPEQSQADAQRYLDFLTANGYKKIPNPGAPGAISLLSLEDSFEVVFVQGRILAGVHDASSSEAALELAAMLQTALKEKP
ncbi:MAG: DUF6599 family protein [Thermodesulfobacteriota bacterium]